MSETKLELKLRVAVALEKSKIALRLYEEGTISGPEYVARLNAIRASFDLPPFGPEILAHYAPKK